MADEDFTPRPLSSLEKELLLWLLPADRPGYREYRPLVESWHVAAKGRRGEGNYILAAEGATIDNDSPLPQVFAYGIVEAENGRIAVTLRERSNDQLEFEIVNLSGESLPGILRQGRRWTYSQWLPGQPCPRCGGTLREVTMNTAKGRRFVLAICSRDERIWVYDGLNGVNHPIPLTNFYNELMLHAKVRDPNVALNSRRLFMDLGTYSDATLSRAFVSYNSFRTKVVIEDAILTPEDQKMSFFGRLRSRMLKHKSHEPINRAG
ncbi:MAG TPA: hypothetical protein VI758_03600 [Bacteroidota bacterium]